MLTIDNLNTSSAAVAVLDEATNCTIAFGRFVYYLGTLAYLCGRETRRYYESELLQQIETIVGIVLWLIHWFQPDTSTSTNSLLLAPEVEATQPVAVEAVAAPKVAEIVEPKDEPVTSIPTPEPVATMESPLVASVGAQAIETTEPPASTLAGKRRTNTRKPKAQAKSTTSSRSKTKSSTTRSQ
jgi:hypothetical protein